MDNYNKELENKLLEMVKEKEAADKRLLSLEIIIGIVCIVVFGKVYGFKLRRNTSGVRGFKRVAAFFIGPTMIPVLIYLAFSMIRYIKL